MYFKVQYGKIIKTLKIWLRKNNRKHIVLMPHSLVSFSIEMCVFILIYYEYI